MNPVQTFPPYFPKIISNVRISHKLSRVLHVQPILLDLITLIFGEIQHRSIYTIKTRMEGIWEVQGARFLDLSIT